MVDWLEDGAEPLTVGAIRAAMEGLPDDAQAFVTGPDGWDRALDRAWASWQIPWSDMGEEGVTPPERQVLGLELKAARFEVEDGEPPCRHAPRGGSQALLEAAAALGSGPKMRVLVERESCDWWADKPVATWLRERALSLEKADARLTPGEAEVVDTLARHLAEAAESSGPLTAEHLGAFFAEFSRLGAGG